MPHCFVLQPSGKWAIYSTISDALFAFDLTEDEAIVQEMRWTDGYPGGKEALRRDLLKEVEIVRATGRAWDWGRTWVEAIGATLFFQGNDAEIVQCALECGALSPEDYATAKAWAAKARAECDVA
jgi:hypothetical protein